MPPTSIRSPMTNGLSTTGVTRQMTSAAVTRAVIVVAYRSSVTGWYPTAAGRQRKKVRELDTGGAAV
jgi:hypothetical protein